MIRRLIGRYVFTLDGFVHRFHIPHPATTCLIPDITVGWGPGCEDWGAQKNFILKWFYNWYWQGKCTICENGVISLMKHKQPDGSWKDYRNVTCPVCSGTSKGEWA